jgi:hypothetical protein
MNAQSNSRLDHQDQMNETTADRHCSQVAASRVVNRTHRVVRERAQVMKARRSYVRSLMVPLALCSALLILSVAAVWTGLYEYQGAADALQDVSSSIAAASDDEFMVMLFWFVPVTLVVMGTLWVARTRSGLTSGIGR